MRRIEPIKALWKHVEIGPTCWIWVGPRDACGYGVINSRVDGQRGLKAHRLAYMLHIGEIPQGLYVCHTCDNPPCVNPSHLFIGTQKENVRDSMQKGRFIGGRGERHAKARLTNIVVQQIRDLYNTGKYTQIQIAKLFNIARPTVSHVTRGASWKHVG